MKTFSIGDEYFSLTLDERRDRFLKLSPAISALEQRVLSCGGNRLIYMPEVIHVDELTLRGRLVSEPVDQMRGPNLAGQCHSAALSIWKATSGEARAWNGFALSLDDGLWRPHSWVFWRTFFEVTPTARDAYFGFELTDEESEDFVKHHFRRR